LVVVQHGVLIGRILSVLLLAGCAAEELPALANSDGLDRDARIQYLVDLIKQQSRLPGGLIDAHYVEVPDGDEGITFFARIDIDPSEQMRWARALGERGSDVEYDAPQSLPDWWIGEAEFGASTLYSPKLFGLEQGWACMARNGKRLWVYSVSG
jgi:hypothetical protein